MFFCVVVVWGGIKTNSQAKRIPKGNAKPLYSLWFKGLMGVIAFLVPGNKAAN